MNYAQAVTAEITNSLPAVDNTNEIVEHIKGGDPLYIETRRGRWARIEWTDWEFDNKPRFVLRAGNIGMPVDYEEYLDESDIAEEMTKWNGEWMRMSEADLW